MPFAQPQSLTVSAGFTDASFAADPSVKLGPLQKREHLHAFHRAKAIHRQCCLSRSSLIGILAVCCPPRPFCACLLPSSSSCC